MRSYQCWAERWKSTEEPAETALAPLRSPAFEKHRQEWCPASQKGKVWASWAAKSVWNPMQIPKIPKPFSHHTKDPFTRRAILWFWRAVWSRPWDWNSPTLLHRQMHRRTPINKFGPMRDVTFSLGKPRRVLWKVHRQLRQQFHAGLLSSSCWRIVCKNDWLCPFSFRFFFSVIQMMCLAQALPELLNSLCCLQFSLALPYCVAFGYLYIVLFHLFSRHMAVPNLCSAKSDPASWFQTFLEIPKDFPLLRPSDLDLDRAWSVRFARNIGLHRNLFMSKSLLTETQINQLQLVFAIPRKHVQPSHLKEQRPIDSPLRTWHVESWTELFLHLQCRA